MLYYNQDKGKGNNKMTVKNYEESRNFFDITPYDIVKDGERINYMDFNKYANYEVKRIESDEVTGVDTLYI